MPLWAVRYWRRRRWQRAVAAVAADACARREVHGRGPCPCAGLAGLCLRVACARSVVVVRVRVRVGQ
eukprot:3491848-Lingulodinium_polyedra.AAC.1